MGGSIEGDTIGAGHWSVVEFLFQWDDQVIGNPNIHGLDDYRIYSRKSARRLASAGIANTKSYLVPELTPQDLC